MLSGDKMKKILIVDDDEYINSLLCEAIKNEGWEPLCAFSGTEALLLLSNHTPDLVLLDLMLPGMSGEELIKKINGVPVIVISAKIDTDNKVNLLLGGAADYVTKPFELRELMARIKIQLRNAERQLPTGIIEAGSLRLDMNTCMGYVDGCELKLTRTELAILKVLMLNAPNVVTKSALLDKISLETPDCVESSLKVHISNIRKKLREHSDREYIESVWGIGFRLNEN